MTAKYQNITFLDGLRGVAILLVFAFHSLWPAFGFDQLKWNGWVRDFDAPHSMLVLLPLTLGWLGVAVFFVVSGFCIQLSWDRRPDVTPSSFYIRRFFRIYPPYLLVLLLFAYAFPWMEKVVYTPVNTEQVMTHVLLVQNFHREWLYGINASFWSIAVEFQLYLLYPVLRWFVKQAGWVPVLWLTGVVEASIRIYISWSEPVSGIAMGFPLSFWFSWSLGAFLADQYRTGRETILWRIPMLVWSCLVLGVYFIKPLYALAFPLTALLTAGIMARLLATHFQVRVASKMMRILEGIGRCSYSIYLIHQPLVGSIPLLLAWLLPSMPYHPLIIIAWCWILLMPILVISRWMFLYVEIPSIRLGSLCLSRMQSRLPA